MTEHNDLGKPSMSRSVVGLDEASIARNRTLTSISTVAPLPADIDTNAPQLTLKAIIAGIMSGSVCTFLALYYGLKTGIIPSMNILGGVLGFAITRALMKTGLFGKIFTPQENAAIQTLSVACYNIACPAFGFANGWLGLSRESYEYVGNIPGNRLTDTIDINYWRSLLWCLSLVFFGLFIAYPLRNYYVVNKRLLFPSGTATAYVISSLHASASEAKRGLAIISKYLSLAFCVNMLTWEFKGLADLPIFGIQAGRFGWVLDFDLGSFGIGMLLSLQINSSMLLGALMVYGAIQPWISAFKDSAMHPGGIREPGDWIDSAHVSSPYLGLNAYSLFSGLAIMIVQGLWSTIEVVVTVIMANIHEYVVDEEIDQLTAKRDAIFTEKGFPLWASALGYVLFGALCCLIHWLMLDSFWYQTVVALIIIPVLAMSNIEGMGRTDWDIASSYGKLMMFPIGWWNKNGSIIPSVAVCHTTISGCSNSATLMQDFKTGYLLGTSPHVMFWSQIIGSLAGCLICPALFVMLRSAFTIPTKEDGAFITGFYGPVYRTLAVVATGDGFEALPAHCLHFCIFFVCLALILNTAIALCDYYKPQYSKFLPDPSAMSIGMLVGAGVPLEFFIGGVITHIWARHRPVECNDQKNYIASGFISGSGLAIILAVIVSLGGLSPNVKVQFETIQTVDYMGAKEWFMATIALTSVICIVILGTLVWFLADPIISEENRTFTISRSGNDSVYAELNVAQKP